MCGDPRPLLGLPLKWPACLAFLHFLYPTPQDCVQSRLPTPGHTVQDHSQRQAAVRASRDDQGRPLGNVQGTPLLLVCPHVQETHILTHQCTHTCTHQCSRITHVHTPMFTHHTRAHTNVHASHMCTHQCSRITHVHTTHVHTPMYTHHTCAHTHHICAHTNAHTCAHTPMFTHHTCAHTNVHVSHMCTHQCTHTTTHVHTHTAHVHTPMHKHHHTCAHTRMLKTLHCNLFIYLFLGKNQRPWALNCLSVSLSKILYFPT